METTSRLRTDTKRNYWSKHITEWQQSGLSQGDYCNTHNLSLSTFHYWRRKLKDDQPKTPRFYPVTVAARQLPERATHHQPAVLTLQLGGGNRFAITVNESFCPAHLGRLITTLEQL